MEVLFEKGNVIIRNKREERRNKERPDEKQEIGSKEKPSSVNSFMSSVNLFDLVNKESAALL